MPIPITNSPQGDANTVWHAYRTSQGTLVVTDRVPTQATNPILLPRAAEDASPALLSQLATMVQKNPIFLPWQQLQPHHVDLLAAFIAGAMLSFIWRWLAVWRWMWRGSIIVLLMATIALLYGWQRPKVMQWVAVAKQYVPAPLKQPLALFEQTQQKLRQLQQLSPQLDAEQKRRLQQLEQLEQEPYPEGKSHR